MNYERRESLCSPAVHWVFVHEKVPVYKFLKESITRKYGKDLLFALEKMASEYFKREWR